jgi:hypothetical protein
MTIPIGYVPVGSGLYMKSSDGSGPYLFNADGSMSQGFPKKLFTDSDQEYARLRVDVSQTSFFRGTAFRAFKRLNIAASGKDTIKIIVGVNTVLQGLKVITKSGDLDMSTRVGMTETLSFSNPLPSIFRSNNMSSIAQPPYTSQNQLLTGGTVTTGTGTEISVLLSKTSNNTQQSSSVGENQDDDRGVSIGSYYFDLNNLSGTDAIVGALYLQWEERP